MMAKPGEEAPYMVTSMLPSRAACSTAARRMTRAALDALLHREPCRSTLMPTQTAEAAIATSAAAQAARSIRGLHASLTITRARAAFVPVSASPGTRYLAEGCFATIAYWRSWATETHTRAAAALRAVGVSRRQRPEMAMWT